MEHASIPPNISVGMTTVIAFQAKCIANDDMIKKVIRNFGFRN